MTARALQRRRPQLRLRRRGGEAAHLRAAGGRRGSLDEVVSSAWAAICAGAPVACPVCGEHLASEGGGDARCGSCASSLS